MKKLICLVLAVAMVLGCVGCQGKEEEQKTTLTVWAVPLYDEFETAINDVFIPAFEEKYSNIKINLEMQTWEGIGDKLQMAHQSGEYPDVYIDGTARCAALPGMGVLEPVDDIYEELGGWSNAVSNIGVLDGVHYLVPETAMSSSTLTVNMDLARELGIDGMLPEDHMSWDIHDMYEFVKAAAEVGADQGIQGMFLYAGSSTSDDVLYSLMMSNGGSIIDKETMTCTANSPECVEVVQVLGDIVQNGYAVPGAAMLTGGDASTMFLNQNYVLALNASATGAITSFGNMVEEGYLEKVPDVQCFGIPHAEGIEMESACWGANTFAIFKNEDQTIVDAAKTMVKEFVGMDEMTGAIWNGAAGYPPARTTSATFNSDSVLMKDAVAMEQKITSDYANSDFGILETYWPEIRNCFYPELQAVYNGDKTAQEAMDSFVLNVNEVLAKYK